MKFVFVWTFRSTSDLNLGVFQVRWLVFELALGQRWPTGNESSIAKGWSRTNILLFNRRIAKNSQSPYPCSPMTLLTTHLQRKKSKHTLPNCSIAPIAWLHGTNIMILKSTSCQMMMISSFTLWQISRADNLGVPSWLYET